MFSALNLPTNLCDINFFLYINILPLFPTHTLTQTHTQASPDYLQSPHETTINTDGFILRSRSVEIRFRIDKTRSAKSQGIMKMKCLAKIEQFPTATREKTTKVFIMSANDFLNNQKLINWRNSGEFFLRLGTGWFLSFFFIFLFYLPSGECLSEIEIHIWRFLLVFVLITGSSSSSIQLLLTVIIPLTASLIRNNSFSTMS